MDTLSDLLNWGTGGGVFGFGSVLALKGFVLLLGLIVLFGFLRNAAPSFRQSMLRLGFLSLLLLPVASLVMPEIEWRVLPVATADRSKGGAGTSLAEGLSWERSSGEEVTATSPVPGSGLRPTSLSAAGLISLAWILGSFVLVSRAGIGKILAHRLISRAVLLTDRGWGAELARFRRKLGVRGKVRLLKSSEIEVPIAVGLLHPAILIPSSAVHWSGQRRRAVLIHELAHIKHRDLCFQLIAGLTCALHWFNPLAWMAERLLRLESERSCDSEVIASGFRPSEYARHLLAVAHEFNVERLAGGTIAMVKRSQLDSRILSILGSSSVNRGSSTLGLAGLVVSITCFVAILAGLTLTSASATPVSRSPETTAELQAPAPPEPPAPAIAPEPPGAPTFAESPAPPSPPAPPAPPTPPEPPAPASVRGWEEGRVMRWHDEEGELWIDIEGVVLSEDRRSIASIETSGYLNLERRSGGRIERIELRQGPGGVIQRSYSVDGVTQPWNETAADLEVRAVRAVREVERAREEMERVRTVELPRVRKELQRIKEIDFNRIADEVAQAQKAVQLAQEELSQFNQEKALGLKAEELQRLHEQIQQQKLDLAEVESEGIKRAAEQLRKLKEELPEQLELQLQKLDELEQRLEEQKDVDP